MMSPSYIAAMSREAAERAAKRGLKPMVIEKGDVASWRRKNRCPIPNIGDLRPQGWEMVEHHMVDSSGFGADYEPAMTLRRFYEWVETEVEGTGKALAWVEEAQFQIVVGLFEAVK